MRVALLVVGAYVGFLGAFVHRHEWRAGGAVWPWGLVLSVAVTALVAVAAARLHRVGAAWFALGWGLALMVPMLGASGSYLVADDWLGWTYALAGAGAIGGVLFLLPRLSR
jgi:hypothetical protein